MKVVDFISILIMTPAIIYGSVAFYFLSTGALYFLFRRINWQDYKKMARKDLRLGESFIDGTKRFFWLTYSPLFVVVIMFRLVMPLDGEKYDGYVFISIIGYIFILLFSGYVFPRETKAETNFRNICSEVKVIMDDYQKIYSENCLGKYWYFVDDALGEYENTGKHIYERFVDVAECKKAAHVFLLSTLYDFLVSGEWKWAEDSRKCSCDFFAYVAKISLQRNYVDKQIIAQYITEIKKQK